MTRLLSRQFSGEFIYVDQELPELATPVLIVVPEADQPVWIASLYEYGWVYTGESDAITLEVVAWAPIPSRSYTHEESTITRDLSDHEIATQPEHQ